MKTTYNNIRRNLIYKAFIAVFAILFLSVSVCDVSFAATDYEAEAQLRKELPIQSNDINSWPHGPEITAEAAIVMEAGTGTILYAKNINEELYPASTTKIMTCLLAVENASLADEISFSDEAVFSVPKGGSNIGMDVGQSITLEQALYGIMVGSANEVANAVAEHVSGSISAFVDLMNERAKELGCTNTHFSNTNGLQADDHYTSAYDLALIARAFFSNELLCKVGNTARYHFEATDTQPDDFYLNNKHKLISGEMTYEGIVGGKTGYTDLARETLVTCAEKDGLKLICVVLMEESPSQFTDTVTLFNYGFNNFKTVNVADEDSRYMPDDSLFFESDRDVFGRSGTILKLSRNDQIIIPKTSSIEDTDYEILYDLTDEEKSQIPTAIAKVAYTFNGAPIGNAYVCYSPTSKDAVEDTATSDKTIFINVKILLAIAGGILILATIIGSITTLAVSGKKIYTKSDKLRYNRRKREYKKTKFKSKKF
ncbi:D-alanyl-D-alanine carboxypeptidase family protein [Butyrivibrio sp. NC2007]|uniref:D-alanyl-D-alanine carboxypeptidase family protein n=1 Tax=Butyrivibrio sp. NC2007 TaxID=1280683 RepID=UPI0003B5224C|nr:D-alanyl-D-alanine carboxypeptidase family protein [Butyrivibrio sp. NC2007]